MKDTLIVNQGEVRRLLPMDKCIGLMRRALEALARGDAVQPLRADAMLHCPDSLRHSGVEARRESPRSRGSRRSSRQQELMMKDTLIVNQGEVRRLLPMDKCIGLMRRALEALARGDAVQPLRSATWLPDRSGLLGLMPGFLGQPPVLGVKVVTVFPDNHGTMYESHQGAILLFDVEHGQLLAIIDGTEITAIRTAAVSGVATSLLARRGAGDLALLGSGVQARTHLEAMRLVRDLTRVRVWSRNHHHARRFAERESQRHSISIEAVSSVEEAVDGAELICTVTAAQMSSAPCTNLIRGQSCSLTLSTVSCSQ